MNILSRKEWKQIIDNWEACKPLLTEKQILNKHFIEAYANGKRVLCDSYNLSWYKFDIHSSNYSIASEPEYEPFTADDWEMFVDKWIINEYDGIYKITSFDANGICGTIYQQTIEKWKFIDLKTKETSIFGKLKK